MSLPKRYGQRIRRALGVRAVWLPGDPVALGDILVRNDGRFFPHDHLSSFGASFSAAEHQDKSLDLATGGTKQTLVQAGAELRDANQLDLAADASLKLEFSDRFEFILKSPNLQGRHITDVGKVARAVSRHPDWRHDKFFIVHEVYEAADWTFLGTELRGTTVDVAGKGAGLLAFITAGASAGITITGRIDLKIAGKGGALAMALVRIRKDGTTKHD